MFTAVRTKRWLGVGCTLEPVVDGNRNRARLEYLESKFFISDMTMLLFAQFVFQYIKIDMVQ